MTTNAPAEPILLNGEPLEEVEDFTYLWGKPENTSKLYSTKHVQHSPNFSPSGSPTSTV